MRILHTADWHLGSELKHIRRLDDQLARVDEILQICDDRDVDLLLVVGDFIDETHNDRMAPILRRLGELLRPRLARGMSVLVLAGNHDREWVFPLLRSARDLYFEGEVSRLDFVWKPELRVIQNARGESLRLMLLPYPRQSAYDLEAIRFKDTADRHAQMAQAVKQRINTFVAEIKKGPKIPTVVAAHLLIAGQRENGHELTEEADVPIHRVYLPNFAYIALGHVHSPTIIGSANCRYSGSIERVDFGETADQKEVVLFEVDSTGLAGDPEAIPLHPTELLEIEWHEGDDLVELARTIKPNTICKLTLHVPAGTNIQAIQAQARNLIARLCWPPEVHWEGVEGGEPATGSLALDRADWQGTVRAYVREQVQEDDPLFEEIAEALEVLIQEEASA